MLPYNVKLLHQSFKEVEYDTKSFLQNHPKLIELHSHFLNFEQINQKHKKQIKNHTKF